MVIHRWFGISLFVFLCTNHAMETSNSDSILSKKIAAVVPFIEKIYPFKKEKGLLRVKMREDLKRIIKTKNMMPNSLEVRLVRLSCMPCKIEFDNNAKCVIDENDFLSFPWRDDASDITGERRFRGDNRLVIALAKLGKFYIEVRHDTDVEIKLSCGNIVYETNIPTTLHTESTTVNARGNAGYSSPAKECWNFTSKNGYSDPLTTLITKKGNIQLKFY